MRRAMLIAVGVALFLTPNVRAEILPSFMLDYAAWEATHIIVATEGKNIDGVLEVLESWKGHLKTGDTITIPELAEFAKEENRIVPDHVFGPKTPANERPRVSCTRMILFLREPGKARTSREPKPQGWTGATIGGDVQYATVWVEGKKLFAFQQHISPGPTQLTDLTDAFESERKLKGFVRKLLTVRRELEEALAITDTAERAKVLFELTYVPDGGLQWRAFEALKDCGEKATPWMRQLLQDETMTRHYSEAIHVLYHGDRQHVGEILTQFLSEELPYWRRVAPTLQVGWKDGVRIADLDKRRDFKARLERLYAIASTLPYTNYQPADPLLEELVKLWEPVPPPKDDQDGRAWHKALLGNLQRAFRTD